MRFYEADIEIGGDRNHVVKRRNMPAPELAVLMAIHGSIAVRNVAPMPSDGVDRTPVAETLEYLMATYGRSRIGDGDERRPVLRAVFPTWPNVASLPGTAEEAGVPPHQMKGASPEDKAAEEAMRARIRAELEAEQQIAEENAEAARRDEQVDADDQELNPPADGRSELQQLKDQAKALGVDPADIRKAGKSKVKLNTLIAEAQAQGDSGEDTEQNDQEEDSEILI